MLHSALKASLLALMLGAPLAAHAADLYEGPGPYQAPPYASPYEPPAAYPPPQPYGPPPVMRERFGGDFERCRVFHRVRVDPYGREVLHRVRVCDERVAQRAPGWAPPARYGYAPPIYDGPRPARDVGPDFDDE
jgi:hypothetical protein